MTSWALQPAINLVAVLADRRGHRHLRHGSICVCGGGRNIFALEPLPQLGVGLAYVTLQCVTSAPFIARQIVAIARIERYALDRLALRYDRLMISGGQPKTGVCNKQHRDDR